MSLKHVPEAKRKKIARKGGKKCLKLYGKKHFRKLKVLSNIARKKNAKKRRMNSPKAKLKRWRRRVQLAAEGEAQQGAGPFDQRRPKGPGTPCTG